MKLEEQPQAELLRKYISLMLEHHDWIYVRRGLGSARESNLRGAMEGLWKEMSKESRQLIVRATERASQVPRIASHSSNPVEDTTVKVVSDVVLRSLSIIRERTEVLLRRRAIGNLSVDETEIEEEYKIPNVEALVPQLWYPADTPLEDFVGRYVKIGLWLDDGSSRPHENSRPYEYVWVDQVEVYEEPDSSVEDPDQLRGILAHDPNYALDFHAGTVVTFRVEEVQDIQQMVDGTSSVFQYNHLEEGTKAIETIFSSTEIGSLSRERLINTWNSLSDREHKHLISFTRGLAGRGLL